MKVALAIPSVGVCVCVAVNTVIITWLIYHLAVAAFSIVGTYIGRSPLFILIVGLLVLGYIQEVLRLCLPQELVDRIFAEPISYPSFDASVVRAIMLGVEHARMRSVSLTDLLRNSIGYTVMSPVCMSNSFVLFPDWMKWREGTTKFAVTNRHHLEEERPPAHTGETLRRTVSIRRVLLTILRLGFWTLVLKYGLGSIDLVEQLCGPIRRISRGLDFRQLDGFIAFFIAFINAGKFSLYYVVFYGYGRTVGDLQQFMLSPLFERDASRLVVEQPDFQSGSLLKSTQDCSLGEKFIFSEVTMNCLMPDPPTCLLGTLLGSETWSYIYIPWRKLLLSIIPATSVVLKELGAVSGAVLTFLFVLTFHAWNWGNCVWVGGSILVWFLEYFVVKIYKSMRAEEKLISLLSAEWERRIRCLGYAVDKTLGILFLMFFLAHYDAGYWLAKAVFTDWFVLLECLAFMYFNARIALQARTWSSQALKVDNKDK